LKRAGALGRTFPSALVRTGRNPSPIANIPAPETPVTYGRRAGLYEQDTEDLTVRAVRPRSGIAMWQNILILATVVLGWVALQKWILPRLGVPT
jgi:hypothetical protein